MEIQLGFYPQALLIVVARIASVMASVPFFGGNQFSKRGRITMALMMGLLLLPTMPREWMMQAGYANTLPELVINMGREILFGLGVGLVCNAFVTACALCGGFAAMESGLRMAQSLDPATGLNSSIMANVMQMTFIVLVLVCNGHLAILRILGQSFQTLPDPMRWADESIVGMVIVSGRAMFVWGLRLALPIICTSLIINACLALIARLAPDFNVLFMSLPIRLFVGMAMLGLVLRFAGGMLEKMIGEMINSCAEIML